MRPIAIHDHLLNRANHLEQRFTRARITNRYLLNLTMFAALASLLPADTSLAPDHHLCSHRQRSFPANSKSGSTLFPDQGSSSCPSQPHKGTVSVWKNHVPGLMPDEEKSRLIMPRGCFHKQAGQSFFPWRAGNDRQHCLKARVVFTMHLLQDGSAVTIAHSIRDQ